MNTSRAATPPSRKSCSKFKILMEFFSSTVLPDADIGAAYSKRVQIIQRALNASPLTDKRAEPLMVEASDRLPLLPLPKNLEKLWLNFKECIICKEHEE